MKDNENGVKKKSQKLDGFKIFVDCEWTSDNTPISVQCYIFFPNGKVGKFIVINDVYKDRLDGEIIKKWMEKNDAIITFHPMSDDSSIVFTSNQLKIENIKITHF